MTPPGDEKGRRKIHVPIICCGERLRHVVPQSARPEAWARMLDSPIGEKPGVETGDSASVPAGALNRPVSTLPILAHGDSPREPSGAHSHPACSIRMPVSRVSMGTSRSSLQRLTPEETVEEELCRPKMNMYRWPTEEHKE